MRPKIKKKPAVPREKALKTLRFPIVCIGASAGGLEAIEQFLENVPEKSGMAYVVIQHLDPTQKGLLPELLQRVTKMQVFQVKERMVVMPNCVYVIPPNKSMSILKGMFHLKAPSEPRGLRLPIDFFLHSLAEDRQELAIGVILSGMGSDGSTGLRTIKEKNGVVMVQDPATAQFDSMPRNAINSVHADIVAPASELPKKLLDFLKLVPSVKSTGKETEIVMNENDKSNLDKIINLLRTHTGNDFSLYKKSTVYRRIERRLSVHKIDKISAYAAFLQENPKEVGILFKELMIGVTSFFRDPNVWEEMKNSVIPEILSKAQGAKVLRAWIPACSTGEEAYSLAMVFKEALEKNKKDVSLQIFATDLDNEAIENARKGMFPSTIASDVSPSRLSRFFTSTDQGYRVNTEIREMIVFAQHNVIMHPPFTKIDILTCRNLLIYLDAELQKKLFGLFYYSLNPGGVLLLGSAESLGVQSHLFAPVKAKLKIYKRHGSNLTPDSLDFPSSFSGTHKHVEKQTPAPPVQNIQSLADQLLLQHFSPTGILVNEKGDIIYISGRTGKYLEPAVGKANLNIFAMLREGLRNEFPGAFHKAVREKGIVTISNVKVGTNGGTQTVDVNIQWIGKPETLKGMVLIVITEVPDVQGKKQMLSRGKKGSIKQSELEQELRHAHEQMQNTLEEMQTTQEEEKSSNEELQSTNEELQSTNEELTTSKEEMQSLNEELQTLNAELQSKVDEYSRVSNDMKNLLNSTDIATLFLDKELNIRRYTNQATKIFKLIKSDIGRPFTDLVSNLEYQDLSVDALEVLRTLIFIEKQIITKDGRWYLVRIMPYRTFDDRIDGLVITFINISDLKKMEERLYEEEQLRNIFFNASSDVAVKLSLDFIIQDLNAEAATYLGKKQEDIINQSFVQMFIIDTHRTETRTVLFNFLKDARNGSIELQVITAGDLVLKEKWKLNILFNMLNVPSSIILIKKKNKYE